MQSLDSDVASADSKLHVEFYECQQEGQWKGKPFVRIITPGDKTNVIDQPVREDHKRRFQRAWLYFQAKSTENLGIGLPLLQWHRERPDELTDGALQELIILKFQTVEQLATASDGQLMRMGMGAVGLRERARMYVTSKNAQTASGVLEQQASEIAELKAMVLALSSQDAKPKPRRGGTRPRKVKGKVNEQQHAAATGATSL